MAKKIFIILTGGLVSDVLVDAGLADDVYVEVLNLDKHAPDAEQRVNALNRMINDEYMTGVNFTFPDEIY